MSDRDPTTIGALPDESPPSQSAIPLASTLATWTAWLASLGVLAAYLTGSGPWRWGGVIAVDGLTVVVWTAATFFSGIVHSYGRRYMAGEPRIAAFFATLFAFTVAVAVLVAADHVALFAAAWLGMGLTMAEMIGHVREDPEARAARRHARRSFLLGGTALAVGLAAMAYGAGTASIANVLAGVESLPTWTWGLGVAALGLAAVIQSALVPFHTWLMSSMTAPTPASAIMHAGFVNAGGILLARFAPAFALSEAALGALAVVGATSALLGKLFRSVQTDVKRRLGCSTTGQMGFMILQAGLGFFAAAITHLVLHGFYKAYRFLGSGAQIQQTAPEEDPAGTEGPIGWLVALGAAIAGGGLFVALTGKGAGLDSGLLLAGLVTLTMLQSARHAVRSAEVAGPVRYLALPLAFLPAIASYALAYNAVHAALAGLPAITSPVALTPVHVALGVAFLGAYLGVETGLHRRSRRLYVWLVNGAQPHPETVVASEEEPR
jgi:NAD(P)H-quinone oxidoreductase subunit 5